jgi:hypothetical protein
MINAFPADGAVGAEACFESWGACAAETEGLAESASAQQASRRIADKWNALLQRQSTAIPPIVVLSI